MSLSRNVVKRSPATRLRRRPTLLALEDRLAPAIISGAVFLDANGSGSRDAGEPGMPGVTVYLDVNNNGQFDPPSGGTVGDPAAKSDLAGNYTIQTIAAGTFSVRQVVPTGFVQTTPDAPPLTINSTGTYIGPEFGNKQAGPVTGGLIRGRVFIDADGNGQQNNNEVGQGGVVVFLDLNNNGKFDPQSPAGPGEPSVLSGNLGGYEFKVPVDGKFTVGEVVPPGYVATTPVLGAVSVAGGATVDGPNFGNKLAQPPAGGVIRGTVFIDADGNGQQSNTEPGQPGVLVYLDLNNNGQFDPPPAPGTFGEPATQSGSNGGYELKVGKDGEVVVAEVVPPGFTATTPASGKVTVSGGAAVDGPDFGNKQATQGGLIRGLVFLDRNSNGKLDPATPTQPGEPGLPGVTVFLDLNGNGKLDPGPTPGTPGEPATLSGPNGRYEFKVGKDGDYSVAVVVPNGLIATTPTSGKVSITGGQTGNGPLFGLNKAPQTGGVVRGHVFLDLNGDGTRQNNEPGQPGVIVFADLNGNGKFDAPSPGSVGEPAVKSGPGGGYELRLKADGDYLLREVVPPGFTQTTPNPGKITVAGGAKVAGPAFGNQPPPPVQVGGVAGRVFVDFNNNGKLDLNEPGMPGVRVYSDGNNNGKFDVGERSTFSNLLGFYLLTLPAGPHVVRQVVPAGFVQTAAPGPIIVAPNQIIPNANFGNRPGGLGPMGSDFNPVGVDDDADEPALAPPADTLSFLGGVDV